VSGPPLLLLLLLLPKTQEGKTGKEERAGITREIE